MSYYLSAEALFNQMTNLISNVDTSENSYVYNALMPSAMEMSYSLLNLDEVEKKVFATLSAQAGYSDYLDLRVQELGVTRKPATFALVEVQFIGKTGTIIKQNSIVSTSDNRMYLTTTEVTIGVDGTVICEVQAEKAGNIYNVKTGDINYLPIKYNGVVSVTNPADYQEAYNKETDLELLSRYLLKARTPATSGNVYQYKQWCLEVIGVGDAHVYPLRDENFVKKNGHVTCVITDSNYQSASPDLIDKVKKYIDPDDGMGEGQAPIGATLHVISVTEIPINVSVDVQFDATITTLDIIKSKLNVIMKEYLSGGTFASKQIHITKVGSLIYDVDGVSDYANLTINGLSTNLNLTEIQVATLGTLSVNPMP